MRFFSRRHPAPEGPTEAETLADILGVLEEIRDDLRGVREAIDGLDSRTVGQDVHAIRGHVELIADRLDDASSVAAR